MTSSVNKRSFIKRNGKNGRNAAFFSVVLFYLFAKYILSDNSYTTSVIVLPLNSEPPDPRFQRSLIRHFVVRGHTSFHDKCHRQERIHRRGLGAGARASGRDAERHP